MGLKESRALPKKRVKRLRGNVPSDEFKGLSYLSPDQFNN
jgi:hypothetical protein